MGIKETAIKQFGKQAEVYSKENILVDREHLSEIARRSGISNNHSVLDIATGAGFLALEFAKRAGTVIGSDITRNMLQYAVQKQKNSGLDNTGFILADVESLPFYVGTFDIVTCRFAFHHFPDPAKALLEMKRVCRPNGRIVLVDGISSEDRYKSHFHNTIEKMRDPSHVCIYTLSEMKEMFNSVGAVIADISHRDIPQDFEEWIKRAGTGNYEIQVIERLMRQSLENDSTGLRVIVESGKLGFTYDTVILIADFRR
ncbi:MAG TPA: methyltransferase domain-containing protein [Candidatus Methanoperedens sp.]